VTIEVKTWQARSNEQDYAKLNDLTSQKENRYGQRIDLLDVTHLPEKRSLFINGNPVVGDNPNRNKQHGFFFAADNCIGCHACEAACSEKNNTPSHLAFRSVGYIEGGTFPDYKRLNISMACNHCDDPVCLKGCPTRAYTKHAEYGAVLQDPETCFGCGYCTWVCPYNAPQLDPIAGQVSKCNMCVDRLEVGLKPACVSACVGNALDFGVIENIPENRQQAETSIPGFPEPSITQPNIRFQQLKDLPETMNRPDDSLVSYKKDNKGIYKPSIEKKSSKKKCWNLNKLSSRENPLVIFTLLAQASIGTFIIVFLSSWIGSEQMVLFNRTAAYPVLLLVCLIMIAFGLFMSTVHLGKPLRFYRGFNNLRYSPVCREGLGIALFMTFLVFHILANVAENTALLGVWLGGGETSGGQVFPSKLMTYTADITGFLAALSGGVGLYYMNRCYRIKARPFWDHWQVASSFFGNMLSLGSAFAGSTLVAIALVEKQLSVELLNLFGGLYVFGLLLESIGLYCHRCDLRFAQNEGGASYYIQTTTFGMTYGLRNILLFACLLTAACLLIRQSTSPPTIILWATILLLSSTAAIISRALFYVLVIPTTMPGAFFWKNKGFEQHARDIGLADMPQVGILADIH
jgi:DMSO reductase iron-sulfur subunit